MVVGAGEQDDFSTTSIRVGVMMVRLVLLIHASFKVPSILHGRHPYLWHETEEECYQQLIKEGRRGSHGHHHQGERGRLPPKVVVAPSPLCIMASF